MSQSPFDKSIKFLVEIQCFRFGRADLSFPGQDRVNHEAICRTAPATEGLLIIMEILLYATVTENIFSVALPLQECIPFDPSKSYISNVMTPKTCIGCFFLYWLYWL